MALSWSGWNVEQKQQSKANKIKKEKNSNQTMDLKYKTKNVRAKKQDKGFGEKTPPQFQITNKTRQNTWTAVILITQVSALQVYDGFTWWRDRLA